MERKDKGKTIKIDIRVAKAYLENSQYDKAIEIYKKIIQKSPEDIQTRTELGLAYIRKGQYDKVIAECQKAIELNRDYTEAYLILSKGHLRKGNYQEALLALKKALELEPDNKEALPQSGKNLVIMFTLDEVSGTRVVIRASLVEGASEARRHNKDASAKGGELCYASASLVGEASEARRHNRDTLYQLGLTYDHLGIPDKAKEEYRKVYQKEETKNETKLTG